MTPRTFELGRDEDKMAMLPPQGSSLLSYLATGNDEIICLSQGSMQSTGLRIVYLRNENHQLYHFHIQYSTPAVAYFKALFKTCSRGKLRKPRKCIGYSALCQEFEKVPRLLIQISCIVTLFLRTNYYIAFCFHNRPTGLSRTYNGSHETYTRSFEA